MSPVTLNPAFKVVAPLLTVNPPLKVERLLLTVNPLFKVVELPTYNVLLRYVVPVTYKLSLLLLAVAEPTVRLPDTVVLLVTANPFLRVNKLLTQAFPLTSNT